MRRQLFLFALLLSACSSPMSPAPALAGTWSESFSFPGASLVVTLDQSGNGSGTYSIEAGRSGTLQVSGVVAGSTVTLVLQYDYGLTLTFTGTLSDTNHLVGTFGSNSGTVTFSRR